MQYLKSWRGEENRKRRAEESSEETSRKRPRDEIDKGESIGIVSGDEYKIRGRSTTSTQESFHPSSSFPNQSASSPVATEPLEAPASPTIRPDRRANIFNPAPPLQNTTDGPRSPLSRSPEHINAAEPDGQPPKSLHSTSHPNLRLDTLRTLISSDTQSPDYTPVMTSHSDEIPRHSPSHDLRKPSIDGYRNTSNPPSRRQSDIMPPPPKVPSPPTKSDVENRQPSISTQPQAPLLDSLNGFAQSIMSAASLTVRRDLTKQQAVGQQKERDRQSKFRSTFLTLIEDVESRSEGVDKVSIGIEKQIDLSSEAQSKIAMALASQLQKAGASDAPPSARDRDRLKDDLADIKGDLKAAKKEIDITRNRGHFKDDLADLKVDLRAVEREIHHLKREAVMADELRKKLRGLATKDELRGLATTDELHEISTRDKLHRAITDEVRKHVTEALVPTEKKLASLIVEDANLNQKIKDVEAVTHKHHETAERKDQQQSSRFGRLDTSLDDIQMELNRIELIIQEQRRDYATIKVDLGAQDKVLADLDSYVKRDPSDDDPSLDKLVMGNSDRIQLLQQDYEKLNELVRQVQDLQATSKIESSSQLSKTSVKPDARIEEEIKLIWNDLVALKSEQEDLKLVRHDMDALKADREKVVLIRADLDSLISEEKLKDMGVAEGFEAIEESLNRQHEDLARQQNEIRLVKQSQAPQTVPNHPSTPPLAIISTSPYENDHQQLQDVETGLKKLTKITQGLELFVKSQQQKFDGLTSDRVVQGMVHQMQQMYPQHPGNLLNLVTQNTARQARVDSYLSGNLKDRLASIESQIAAREGADSKVEEIAQFTAESRKILLATTNSLRQDMEELKEVALNKRSQDSSDYGNQIDELTHRVTTVEARYVKAIDDFQTRQTDLVRKVTHLHYRNGIDSIRNTPGEVSVVSRSSKSVEANGNIISLEDINDSDSSNAPLSQRWNHEIRRDSEECGPSDPDLKRKVANSDDDDESAAGKARPTNKKRVPKRRNVSGKKTFP